MKLHFWVLFRLQSRAGRRMPICQQPQGFKTMQTMQITQTMQNVR
jgi:hypothetical protein